MKNMNRANGMGVIFYMGQIGSDRVDPHNSFPSKSY